MKALTYFKWKPAETLFRNPQNTSRVGERTKITGPDVDEAGRPVTRGGIREPLVEKDGEIEWLEKRLAETQAELDSSGNEVEGLRKLNSAWSWSVLSASSTRTPP